MAKHRMDKEKKLRYCTVGLFAAYMAVLLRITLFKQAAGYNFSAAVGASEQTISMIPFKSLFEMISSGISAARIIENVLGNVAVFLPFGLLLPLFQKEKSNRTILYGMALSLSIEVIQFVLALGSSDMDDLIFNTLGTIAGYTIYKCIHRKSRTDISAVISIIVFVSVLGTAGLGLLFVNHTELFMLSRKEVVVENEELVQDFIDTPQYVNGKFVEVKGNILTIEKSVHNAAEQRVLADLEITPKSNIYICCNEINYFFSTISDEKISYEQMEYSEFVLQKSNDFTKENNVCVWSADGKTIDHLVIVKWIE